MQWNTYGDPPNSDLLRRYGHVDLVPLPDGELGNPADIVEVRGDLAVASVSQRQQQPAESSAERVDWWLEEGGEEYVLGLSVPHHSEIHLDSPMVC